MFKKKNILSFLFFALTTGQVNASTPPKRPKPDITVDPHAEVISSLSRPSRLHLAPYNKESEAIIKKVFGKKHKSSPKSSSCLSLYNKSGEIALSKTLFDRYKKKLGLEETDLEDLRVDQFKDIVNSILDEQNYRVRCVSIRSLYNKEETLADSDILGDVYKYINFQISNLTDTIDYQIYVEWKLYRFKGWEIMTMSGLITALIANLLFNNDDDDEKAVSTKKEKEKDE